MEHNHLRHPFLVPSPTTAAETTALGSDDGDADYLKFLSSNPGVILRLLFVISLGVVSVWASHEASKGFGITVINDAKGMQAAKSFSLLYISNDGATRILQSATSFLQTNILHTPNNPPRHVTLRLATTHLAKGTVTVDAGGEEGEFVISVGLSQDNAKLGRRRHLDPEVRALVLQGMARVWLWDSKSRAPPWLLDGMVEYVRGLAGFGPAGAATGWSGDKDPLVVAKLLDCCERRNKGFILRLNQVLTGSDGPGLPVSSPCDSFLNTSSRGFPAPVKVMSF
ncbi:hypothetical protein Tsubulata_038863 [Turnera subulata]|uniref:Uncharacterized protein n=1 Tax=Turnera subulata TaxID=218843 RepID=A0A9Q0FQ09_9ROSI|nr:hypothetical protein Tsubulata_038863 [Turnera subulata]